MTKPSRKEELLDEAKDLCRSISDILPTRVDRASISMTAKIPYKAMVCREALIWRTEELASTACAMFERDNLVAAIILTRACMETAAAMSFLKNKIQNIINKKELGNVDDSLMKLLMGSKNDIISLKAINVLDFVRKVDKKIKGFLDNYEILSEYAHPNWSGTAFVYSRHNKNNYWTDFGKNIRSNESVVVTGLLNLTNSLYIFERYYNEVGNLMPEFIQKCEKALEK